MAQEACAHLPSLPSLCACAAHALPLRRAQGTWHSLVVYFIPMYSMSLVQSEDGNTADWPMVGVTVYTAIVIVLNLKLALRTRCGRLGHMSF